MGFSIPGFGGSGGGGGCGELSADAGGCTVDGSTASTAVNSSHITQVKVPKRDDGRWMSVGAMIGLALSLFVDKATMNKAKDAEDTWRQLTDKLKDAGEKEFGPHAALLKQCDDNLWEKFCEFAMCGYKPDYAGILNRARADASQAAEGQIASARRMADRYNTGIGADVVCDIRRAEIFAVVGATTVAREEERKNAYSINWNLLSKSAAQFENAYQGRLKLGADLMASAGANYASLSASLRETAKTDKGDFATLGALLGGLLPTIMNIGCNPASDCGCS